MKKIIFVLSFILIMTPLFPGTGQSGMAFLYLPPSARAGAVMNVFASNNSSPATIFKSPLGIAGEQSRISFSHNFWFMDVRSEVLALSFPTKYGNFAIGGNFVRIPGIEVRIINLSRKSKVSIFLAILSITKKFLTVLKSVEL